VADRVAVLSQQQHAIVVVHREDADGVLVLDHGSLETLAAPTDHRVRPHGDEPAVVLQLRLGDLPPFGRVGQRVAGAPDRARQGAHASADAGSAPAPRR
jgi:hypothetical protein